MNSKLSAFVKILILAVEAVAIAGGVALATKFWDPAWSPFRPKPEKVILQAWNNLKNIKSHNFDVEFMASGDSVQSEGQSGSFAFDIKGSGGLDFSDKNKILLDATASLTALASDKAGNTYNLGIAGQAKAISKDLYLKLDKLDLGNLGAFFMMFGFDASKIKGQWFKFNLDQSADSISSYTGAPIQQDEGDLEKAKQAINKMTKIMLDKKVYDIVQMPDSQGKNGPEYHYVASLNRKRLLEASPEIYNILKEIDGNGQEEDYTLEKFQKSLNDFMDKAGGIKTEMFIGKKDNFFHKTQSINEFDLSKFNSQSSGKIKVEFRAEQAEINKPVQVIPPENYKTVEQLISELTAKTEVIK